MPKFTTQEAETSVRILSKANFSYPEIKAKLKEEDIDVSISTICRILKNIGIRRSAVRNKQPIPKFARPPIKRTTSVIQKVKRLVQTENPASHRSIQQQTSLTLPTISRVIHGDLCFVTRKKGRVHKLTQINKKNRKTNCRKLYENHLAGSKCE